MGWARGPVANQVPFEGTVIKLLKIKQQKKGWQKPGRSLHPGLSHKHLVPCSAVGTERAVRQAARGPCCLAPGRPG